MDTQEKLTQGSIYLARLDPAKHAEVGKIRPVIILTTQIILDSNPLFVFICPLSSKSQAEFVGLHVKLLQRDSLKTTSYALVEHCRSIATARLIWPRLGQLMRDEIKEILRRLNSVTSA